MPMQLVAYQSSVTSSGTLSAIVPVPDPSITVQGNDFLVPDKYNQVVYAAALVTGHAQTQAQLQSPSLRNMWYPDLNPLVVAATFEGIDLLMDLSQYPLQLATNEGLQFWSDGGGDGTTAQNVYGLVWFADGKLAPATSAFQTIRATASIQQSKTAWANGQLTFDQVLPVGNYDIVGMQASGAGLVAARLVFIGSSALTRPGVVGDADLNNVYHQQFRFGASGVFGTFNSTTPPSIDVLGGTASSQTFLFDLVKRS